MAQSVYSRTLQKAAELIGGRSQLCRHLHVPMGHMQLWIDDKAVPPIGIFLRAVDLVIQETPPPAGGDGGPGDPPAPRDASPAGDSSAPRY